jgi:hypothetical protein
VTKVCELAGRRTRFRPRFRYSGKLMAARKPVPTLPQVTAEEVKTAKTACANFRRLYRAQAAAERARDAALHQIFFKMGFASLEEVKAMSPERLTAEIERRTGASFSFDSDQAREFTILKTWEGRRPDWKSQFLARVGPAIAAEVEKSTRMQYSYSIIEPAAEQQPGVVYLPKRAAQ